MSPADDRTRPSRTLATARWVATIAIAAALLPASAQAQGVWPERAENLQELPGDLTADRLRAVMTGFTRALGVRCSHCHVGEEGQPLSTYDFVSDENPNKDRARAMLRMLGEIDRRLDEVDFEGEDRVNVWCHTCHAGKPRPLTLAEAVDEVYAAEGGEAAVDHFLSLRERFYGGPQYDFRAPSVDGVASGIFQRGDTTTALSFFELNTVHYPEWAPGWESLGDVATARGRSEDAVRYYRRALELDPQNQRIRRKLEAVGGG